MDGARQTAEPIAGALAYPIYGIGWLWNYIIDHTAAAGLLTALIGGTIAIRSIHTTRSVAKLRETFNTFTVANWEAERVNARRVFSEIKKECEPRPFSIANYYEELPPPVSTPPIEPASTSDSLFLEAFPAKSINSTEETLFAAASASQIKEEKVAEYETHRAKHQEGVIILRTILNDYENIALGIRMGILDEDYAYKYQRGTVLHDYQILNP